MNRTLPPRSANHSAMRGRDVRRLEPHEGGLVARRGDDDAPREPLRPEGVLDELAHLAAALARRGR